MRKVTENTVKAFLAGRPCSEGSSRTDGQGYWLHGNKIAQRDEDGTLWLTDCGWQTNTTKERLNGILDLACAGMYLYQLKGIWRVFNRTTKMSYEWPGSMSAQARS